MPAPLYTAATEDPRAREAQPRPRLRAGAVRLGPTSDVTRWRGVVPASIAGAAASVLAALFFQGRPIASLGAPGPLSRPHALASVTCASCHTAQEGTHAAAPASACVGCHGAHPSVRRGHTSAITAGSMTCATCHPIHRSDQGVTFLADGAPIRFAPGAEATSSTAFHPASGPALTVAIPTAGSCKGCHSLDAPRDPIARCLLRGQEALGDARPVVCFDEHTAALPVDARATPRAAGVCGSQHGEDRAAAWEAAREAAATMPIVRASASSSSPATWLGAGLAVAGIVLGAVRGADAARRRRREARAPAPVLDAAPRVRLPQIDTATCLGCHACVDACPYDVLDVERYVAVVLRPDACCGLTLCEQRCPNGSLRITDGEAIGDRPRLDADLQSTDMPGLYLAGDVTGLPLIKNAILQGARATDSVAANLKESPGRARDAVDLVVIGGGPAGISAALRAKELGVSCEVIEEGSVAQSIRSFPRGKLVFDQPLDLPLTGKLWLRESTKEELLAHWLRIVRQSALSIREDTRMTAVARDASGLFQVTVEPREGGPTSTIAARRVILAIGQRGSPRRLTAALSPDAEARVHYVLSDARSFENKRVIVVGLGDVAMEAAIALSRQRSTAITVVHRGEGFARGKSRNVAEVQRLVAAARIGLRLRTEIVSVTRDEVTLRCPSGTSTLGYDAVLVMIGSIPPASTLRAAGVRTVADAPALVPRA